MAAKGAKCISLWTCWLSLGGGGGGGDYSAFKADRSFIPKMSFFCFLPPFFFASPKLLGDPGGAVVQRVHVGKV